MTTQVDLPSEMIELASEIELKRGSRSIVKLERCPKGTLMVVKSSINAESDALIRREASIHKKLKHPLVLALRDDAAAMAHHNSALITEYAANGSLRSYLASAQSETRNARIIVGIVLAMRYIHSQGVIHRDLTPDNIMLDSDWTVRVGDFGHSTSLEEPHVVRQTGSSTNHEWPSGHSFYWAPECYDNICLPASDVFSFGMILYELIAREPFFPDSSSALTVAHRVVIQK
jgi:serine/threonine protein kinase